MKHKTKKRIGFCLLLVTFAFSIYFATIPNETLINAVGTDNVYLFMFLLAFVGSISTFASIPYPLFLLSLAAGGFNPFLLGLASASGVMCADTLTFFSAKRGRALMGEKLHRSMVSLSGYIEKYPRALTPGLVCYGVVSPISNDFAVISLSLMGYAYKKVIPPLAVGNVVYNVGIGYLGVYAYDWIVNLI